MSLGYKDSSIIGGPLETSVTDQLKVRKNLIKKRDSRSDLALQYLGNTTGWVRMVSSVNQDLVDKREQPALDYILLGGTIKASYSTVNTSTDTVEGGIEQTRTGISLDTFSRAGGFFNDNGNQKGSSYSTSEYMGYVPMPGITSMNVRSKNTFGTLREATVQFTAHSVEDFNKLESLYLRPGYTILLEWGHSVYVDNNGDFQSRNQLYPLKSFFSQQSPAVIDSKIVELKEKNSNNYDAIFGFVKNFSWSYDGTTYTCSVDIISKGELIESISMDIPASSTKHQVNGPEYNGQIMSTDLHKFLYAIKTANSAKYDQENAELEESRKDYSEQQESIRDTSISNVASRNFNRLLGTDEEILEKPEEDINIEQSITDENIETALKLFIGDNLYNQVTENIIASGAPLRDASYPIASQVIRYQLSNEDANGEYQWSRAITLRLLLSIINNTLLLKSRNNLPIFKFFVGEKDKKVSTNFYTFLEHIGLDPSICILGKNSKIGATTNFRYDISKQAEFDDEEQKEILNIFVDVDYILTKLKNVIDDTANSASLLIDFLLGVLQDIQNNLGEINEFDLHHDESTNTYYVVDRKVVPDNVVSFIDLVGLNTEVENLSITSKLSSKISTMIAIASSDTTPPAIGSETSNIQKWNEGYYDRHLQVKHIGNEYEINPSTGKPYKVYDVSSDRLLRFITSANSEGSAALSKNSFYFKYTAEDLSGYKALHSKVMKEKGFNVAVKEKTNPHGLIPFELSFTIKGIGGMKIGQCFTIPDAFLPERYKGEVGFLITGLEHRVQNNKWTTDIKTQMVITKKYRPQDSSLEESDENPSLGQEFLEYKYFPPTGKYPMETRNDKAGGGTFAAGRGNDSTHKAWDVVAQPGQSIYAPITGIVSSIGKFTEPVPGKKTTGIRIIGTGNYDGQEFRLGYTILDSSLNGTEVKRGSKIGIHQANMVEIYTERNEFNKNMTPHIHIDIKRTKPDSLYGVAFRDFDPYYLTWTLV